MKSRTSIFLLLIAAGNVAAQSVTAPPPGRLLASNCFQCHGTNGSGGFERLAGMSAREVVSELKEMRMKSSPDIMEAHARGYSDAQLQLIGQYLSSLRTTTTSSTMTTASTQIKTSGDDHDD